MIIIFHSLRANKCILIHILILSLWTYYDHFMNLLHVLLHTLLHLGHHMEYKLLIMIDCYVGY